MGRLVDQVQALTRGYVRKGGKNNRRQQAARMVAFAAFCEGQGCRELGQVGGRHAVRYWQANRHLSASTLYNHHRALAILWQLAGKPGLPPAPAVSVSTLRTHKALPTAKPSFGAVDAALAVSREAP